MKGSEHTVSIDGAYLVYMFLRHSISFFLARVTSVSRRLMDICYILIEAHGRLWYGQTMGMVWYFSLLTKPKYFEKHTFCSLKEVSHSHR